MEHTLKRYVLDTVLENADLFISEDGDTYDDNAVGLHQAYSGRGYGPKGFGLVIEGQRRIARFFTALGYVAGQYDADQTDELGPSHLADDFDTDRAVALADASETDSMGRTGTIVYFPGWTLVED